MIKWFRNLKIAIKLVLTFLLIAAIAGVMGLVGIINMNMIGPIRHRAL